jgi:cell division protein FtsB
VALSVIPRTRSQLLFIACLAVAGYFGYAAVSGWYENHQLAEQRDQAERKLAALEEKRDYLDGVRDYVESDDFVEQQARRELGYVYPDETPVVVISPPMEEQRLTAGDWWERLFPR